jgi:hypothetical protein
MKSLTTSIALLNSMTKVPAADTTNTTLLTQLWNDSVRTVCSIRSGKWWFLQTRTEILASSSMTGSYPIPAGVRSIINIYTTVGTTVYVPIPIFSPEAWNIILASNLGSSDVPQFSFIQGRNILIQPVPSTGSGIITVRGRKNVPDLTIADITMAISTATFDSTAITIAAGGLTSFAGRYIRITNTGVNTTTGDGQWYEIASATATTITLVSPYKGVSVAGGSSTISQMTPIPEAYDMAPIYRTMALFSQINDPLHPAVNQLYWKLYDGGQEAGLAPLVGGMVGQMLEAEGESIEGAYVPPLNSGMINPYTPPYWLPYQDASGF